MFLVIWSTINQFPVGGARGYIFWYTRKQAESLSSTYKNKTEEKKNLWRITYWELTIDWLFVSDVNFKLNYIFSHIMKKETMKYDAVVRKCWNANMYYNPLFFCTFPLRSFFFFLSVFIRDVFHGHFISSKSMKLRDSHFYIINAI